MTTSQKGQIDSGKIGVGDLFGRFWLRVPDYQRAYAWGKDEIAELIDDVSYAAENNSGGQYFLGSIVLRKITQHAHGVAFEEYELLDGQQRLTTIMLILACIRDKVQDEKLKSTCREMLYQAENKWKKIPGRNRIVYDIREDVETFIERFVKPDGGSLNVASIEATSLNNLSLSNMVQAMQIIHSAFANAECFPNVSRFDNFVAYLLNNALFIYVATDDLDDAFRLFTILNDRGIPLSNSDILKARNLGAVPNDKDRTKWAQYWEEVEGGIGRDEFDRFLSLVRTIYVKDKAREGLLREFDDRIYGAKPALLTLGVSTFEAIRAFKEAYDQAIVFDGLPGHLGNTYRNRVNIMRLGLPATDWIPPVLAWYRKFGVTKLMEAVVRIDNKFSADWIVQLTPTQRITNMNDVLRAIENGDPDAILVSQSFAYDKNALMGILAGDVYGRRFAKYVLLRLEYLLSSHTTLLHLPDKISVEHILPQNPTSESGWVQSFTPEEREAWIHKLGNLMLLSRGKNASLSNLDFSEKKSKYYGENVEGLPNSQRVLTLPQFACPELRTRNRDLLSRLDASYSSDFLEAPTTL